MSASSDEIEEPTAPFWMTTFSDMVTLLLTFFVMIVSMSEVQVKKFKEAMSYFQGRTGMLMSESVISTPATSKAQGRDVKALSSAAEQAEQATKYEKLLEYIQAQGLEGKVQVNLTDEGLHFVLNDALMFRPGETELVEPSRTLLGLITTLLTPDVESIVVEGHTDNIPIATSRFPSNWELSTARASSVVRFLLQQPDVIPADRYAPVGKGEFHPLVSNATADGRARNRRVEIFFLWNSWQSKTPPTRP